MSFKVGDKIKFVGVMPKRWIGKIGVIYEVREHGRDFPYNIRLDSGQYYPVLAWEIEKITPKGQQLLFEFME